MVTRTFRLLFVLKLFKRNGHEYMMGESTQPTLISHTIRPSIRLSIFRPLYYNQILVFRSFYWRHYVIDKAIEKSCNVNWCRDATFSICKRSNTNADLFVLQNDAVTTTTWIQANLIAYFFNLIIQMHTFPSSLQHMQRMGRIEKKG